MGAPVDTSSAVGRAFYGMLAVLAAFETDVRRERQLEDIAMAKRQGIYTGGKPRLDKDRSKELTSQGLGPTAVARQLGMARSLSAAQRGSHHPRFTDAFSAAPSCMSVAPSARTSSRL